jgi:hypothetical protein
LRGPGCWIDDDVGRGRKRFDDRNEMHCVERGINAAGWRCPATKTGVVRIECGSGGSILAAVLVMRRRVDILGWDAAKDGGWLVLVEREA